MELVKRKSSRLKQYDYAQNGAYFVTICTYRRENKFGYVCRDNPCGCPRMTYTMLGEIAKQEIEFIEKRYGVQFTQYVIMPNHFHAIITIERSGSDGHPQGASLQQIVGGYKSRVSSQYLKVCKAQNKCMGEVWQPRYHDHVIRNQKSYDEIWEYIDTNVLKWELDRYYAT